LVKENVADTPKPKRTKYKNKQLVQVSPYYLMGFYEEHTRMQAEKLAEPFKGNWIQVSGKVHNVSAVMGTGKDKYIHVSIEEPQLPGRVYHTVIYFLHFTVRWKNKLEVLIRNQDVSVIGKIRRIDKAEIELSDCELVEMK